MTIDDRAGQITRAIMADLPRDRTLVPEHVGPVVLRHVTAALQTTETMKSFICAAEQIRKSWAHEIDRVQFDDALAAIRKEIADAGR